MSTPPTLLVEYDLFSLLSFRTRYALDANNYVFIKRLKQSVLLESSRPSEEEEMPVLSRRAPEFESIMGTCGHDPQGPPSRGKAPGEGVRESDSIPETKVECEFLHEN